MTTPFKYIGSVSHGTLRPEDLIPAFLDVYEELDVFAADRFKADMETDLQGVEEEDKADMESEIVNELFDRLDAFSPPYFYFGAHPGDGADFGFWFDSESFERAVADHEVYKTDETPEWERADWSMLEVEPEYIAVVTDHGNVTLYTMNGEEVWAIV